MVEPFTTPNGALVTAPQATVASEEEQFLRLLLIPDTTIALSVHYLMEVLTVSLHEIVPIPHLPPWVMGIHNWRGEILWMVDLGHLLGLTPWYQQTINRSEFSAIVLHQGKATAKSDRSFILGLVVHEVDDIEWCNPQDIKPLPSAVVTSEMAPFLQGCCWKPDGGMLTIVDGAAIFKAMPTPAS